MHNYFNRIYCHYWYALARLPSINTFVGARDFLVSLFKCGNVIGRNGVLELSLRISKGGYIPSGITHLPVALNLDPDYVLPFAAIPENGREINSFDHKSELAHGVVLVNLLRLLGAVKQKKASRNFVTHPTQVVLLLSPNHGLFGNDGLYSDSKISLETLFMRWSWGSWGEYLGLAGAVIG